MTEVTISTADKLELIRALGRAGYTRIELASFVRPDVLPQLADAAEVLAGISIPDGVARAVLVPNQRGLETRDEHAVTVHVLDRLAVLGGARVEDLPLVVLQNVFDDDVRVRLDDAHGDLRQGEAGEADGTGEADNVGWKG